MNKPNEDFQPYPKVPRLHRDVIVTEKIDGTNAGVYIPEENEEGLIYASSRNRWITPDDDNYGFAKYVAENKEILLEKLGPGMHFGEWWGQGVQRGYGVDSKRFSLFNTHRWAWANDMDEVPFGTVPVLGMHSHFNSLWIDSIMDSLRNYGSVAAPGFMDPEGVMVYHARSGQIFKYTLDHNDQHKESVQ